MRVRKDPILEPAAMIALPVVDVMSDDPRYYLTTVISDTVRIEVYWFTGKLTKRVEGKGGGQLSTGGLQGD